MIPVLLFFFFILFRALLRFTALVPLFLFLGLILLLVCPALLIVLLIAFLVKTFMFALALVVSGVVRFFQ